MGVEVPQGLISIFQIKSVVSDNNYEFHCIVRGNINIGITLRGLGLHPRMLAMDAKFTSGITIMRD